MSTALGDALVAVVAHHMVNSGFDPSYATAATCRSCGAPIRWVVTAATGKRMPLDQEPTLDGNVVVELVELTLTAEAFVYPTLEAAAVAAVDGHPRYLSHFVTCPQAAHHRKRAHRG